MATSDRQQQKCVSIIYRDNKHNPIMSSKINNFTTQDCKPNYPRTEIKLNVTKTRSNTAIQQEQDENTEINNSEDKNKKPSDCYKKEKQHQNEKITSTHPLAYQNT
jgi:hypothetical protein